jgi:cobalt-precorrin-5B (C1)-methyltransferase
MAKQQIGSLRRGWTTGATSEQAVQRLYDLSDHALIEMGDFVGATLKYLRAHPIPRVGG